MDNIKITINDLLDASFDDELAKITDMINKIEKVLYAHINVEDKDVEKQKIGTILIMAVLEKARNGINPKNYSKQDWMDIANAVSEYAVIQDGQQYTQFIFISYANYIKYNLENFQEIIPPDISLQISQLADEIVCKTEQLTNGELKEENYIDDCLWLSFEAIMKILAIFLGSLAGNGYAELANVVTTYAVTYYRLTMLSQEDALLTAYLEKQRILDQELSEKYNAYIARLQLRADLINGLIKNAFSPDFHNTLKGSVMLARGTGVSEDQILKDIDDVDDFFLN